MLVSPAPRGSCLFCSFRVSFAAASKRPVARQRRQISSTIERRERRQYASSKPSPSFPLYKKVSLPERRRTSPRVRLDDPRPRVRTSLATLKDVLGTTKAGADSDVTQLAALDPRGIYWPAYKKNLEEVLKSPVEAGRTGFDGLMADIGRASEGEWAVELPRVLHFGFIDYVLMRKTQDDPEEVSALDELKFPTEWYTNARQVQRDVHLHIGPTNSGKTYNALKRLEESGNGFYAGPLRLLAHEVYSRFRAKGVSCDLVTGDDVRLEDDPDTRLTASTVEMVDVSRHCDVAVIDEIQMMADQDRGWAWTRAFLGANAKEVHICGEARVLPLVRELTASTGDILHVHEYKRLNPLKVMTKGLKGDLKNLRKGDCIVAFSVMNIHALKKQVELDTGRRCAIVYGSLPPETRAKQAALFNDPNNDFDFLVASDAVGMGLNLNVKRIIFHSVVKFNGTEIVTLSTSQIKQIGGRAGRFRNAHQAIHGTSTGSESNVGLVTTFRDEDLHVVRTAMQTDAAPIKRAGMLPPGEAMEDFEGRLPKGIPFEYILRRLCGKAATHDRFSVCSIREQSHVSRAIEQVRGLTLSERIMLTAAPASMSSPFMRGVIKAFANCVADRKPVTVTDVPEVRLEILERPLAHHRKFLEQLEELHKSLVLYLWLSYRFLGIFKDRDMAMYAKELAEERINTCLSELSANPDLRKEALSAFRTIRLAAVAEAESELNVPETEMVLPVDWTRGSDNVEFNDETSTATQAVAASG